MASYADIRDWKYTVKEMMHMHRMLDVKNYVEAMCNDA